MPEPGAAEQRQEARGLERGAEHEPAPVGADRVHAARRQELHQRAGQQRRRGQQAGRGLAVSERQREGGQVRLAEADHGRVRGAVSGNEVKVPPQPSRPAQRRSTRAASREPGVPHGGGRIATPIHVVGRAVARGVRARPDAPFRAGTALSRSRKRPAIR